HRRWTSDWSSEVCSADLGSEQEVVHDGVAIGPEHALLDHEALAGRSGKILRRLRQLVELVEPLRSEELGHESIVGPRPTPNRREIGRASCRERAWISVGG